MPDPSESRQPAKNNAPDALTATGARKPSEGTASNSETTGQRTLPAFQAFSSVS
jgi:hypothetical protein